MYDTDPVRADQELEQGSQQVSLGIAFLTRTTGRKVLDCIAQEFVFMRDSWAIFAVHTHWGYACIACGTGEGTKYGANEKNRFKALSPISVAM